MEKGCDATRPPSGKNPQILGTLRPSAFLPLDNAMLEEGGDICNSRFNLRKTITKGKASDFGFDFAEFCCHGFSRTMIILRARKEQEKSGGSEKIMIVDTLNRFVSSPHKRTTPWPVRMKMVDIRSTLENKVFLTRIMKY